MSFPVYLDERVDPGLAGRLRVAGHDAESATEAGLSGTRVPDEVHIEHAAASGRVLLTHDLKTFASAAQRWLDSGRSHPGVVLCQQEPSSALYYRILRLLEEYQPENLRNAVIWLPRLLPPG